MFTLKQLFEVLDGIAPLKYSSMLIEKGDYDNSGILLKSSDKAEKILFSLDLTEYAVKRAKTLKCDTIVTHHPAIYAPVKSLKADDSMTKAVALAMNYNLNVISMHLNLDVAKGGIDQSLSVALGAKNSEIADVLLDGVGYGRIFEIDEITFSSFIKNIKKSLNTQKIIAYGKLSDTIKTVASFCGGGASYAEREVLKGTLADVIVTSDLPHHVLKLLIESEKKVIILTHYASENYGFYKFYENVKITLNDKAETVFFDDVRFR